MADVRRYPPLPRPRPNPEKQWWENFVLGPNSDVITQAQPLQLPGGASLSLPGITAQPAPAPAPSPPPPAPINELSDLTGQPEVGYAGSGVINYNGMNMPDNDTSRELIKKYEHQANEKRAAEIGMPVDNYEQLKKDYDVKQAIINADKLAAAKAAEKPFQLSPGEEEMWNNAYEMSPDWLKPVTGAVASARRGTRWAEANISSGVAQIPTDTAAFLIDTVPHALVSGVQAFTPRMGVDPVTGRPVTMSYWDNFSQNMMRMNFKDGGMENLLTVQRGKKESLAKQFPGRSEQQINKMVADWMESDEYYNILIHQMNPATSIAEQAAWWANGMAGVGKRPDQQTIGDDLLQMGGQTLVGLPKSAMELLGATIVTHTGPAAPWLKGAGKVIEYTTPATLPLTPGSVAINAAFGAGMTELQREATNRPSLMSAATDAFVKQSRPDIKAEIDALDQQVAANGGKITDEQQAALDQRGAEMMDELRKQARIDPPDGQGVDIDGQIDQEYLAAGGAGTGALMVAAIFGGPAAMKKFIKDAAEAGVDDLSRASTESTVRATSGGKTLEEQSKSKLEPILNPVTGTVSQSSAISKGANQFITPESFEKQFGRPPTQGELQAWGDDTYVRLEVQQAAGTNVSLHEADGDLYNYGILDHSTRTIPYADIERFAQEMEKRTPGKYDKTFYDYANSVSRVQDRKATMENIGGQINDLRDRIAATRDSAKLDELTKQMRDLKDRFSRVAADDPAERPTVENLSLEEARRIIIEAERDPEIMQLRGMMEKFNNDVVSYAVSTGNMSKEAADAFRKRRPWNTLMDEAELAGEPSLWKRAKVVGRDLTGKGETPRGDFSYRRPRPSERVVDPETGDTKVVNEPMHPLAALKMHMMQMYRDSNIVAIRNNVMDTLDTIPGAQGKMYRYVTFKSGKGRTEWLSDEQLDTLYHGKEDRYPNSFVQRRDGRNRVVQFSDAAMGTAMNFAPQSVYAMMNRSRKAWQQLQTGKYFRPDFALVNGAWSISQARLNLHGNRSFGFVDTGIRRITGENKVVNAVANQVGVLPDQWISAYVGIPVQLAHRTAGYVGKVIADDLMYSSGVFGLIGKTPQGRDMLERMGRGMYKWWERSVTNIYLQNVPSAQVAARGAEEFGNNYRLASRGTGLSRAARASLRAYGALMDSVRGAAHFSVFTENVARREALLGRPLGHREMEHEVYQVTNLTGDMTRHSANENVQKATSAIPYGNTILQSLRYLGGALIGPNMAKGINAATGGATNMVTHRSNRAWGQIITGVAIPAFAARMYINSLPKEGQDYIDNKTPMWEKGATLYMPSADALIYFVQNGHYRTDFDPERDLYRVPLAPELYAFNVVTNAALSAMGYGAKGRAAQDVMGQGLAGALDQTTSFATPPPLGLVGALTGHRIDLHALLSGNFDQAITESYDDTFGGVNADKMTWNSVFQQKFYDIMGAVFASGGRMIAESINAGEIAASHTHNPVDWINVFSGAAWNVGTSEWAKRIDNVPGFRFLERNYAFTPEAEYVKKAENDLHYIIESSTQNTVNKDNKDYRKDLNKAGIGGPPPTRDPLLTRMVDEVYGTLKRKGQYKDADSEITWANVQLNALKAKRYSMTEDTYNEAYNDLIKTKQKLSGVQANIINRLQGTWQKQYGAAFKHQFGSDLTFSNFVEAVRADVMSQR